MEIPQDSNLSWLTLFYTLPKELVGKRAAYLNLPRNMYADTPSVPIWQSPV